MPVEPVKAGRPIKNGRAGQSRSLRALWNLGWFSLVMVTSNPSLAFQYVQFPDLPRD